MTMRTFGSTKYADPFVPASMDIYIDANSMTKLLYDFPDPARVDSITPSVIASYLINLAAHLRQYFLSRHGTWCPVYIVYGNNLPDDVMQNYPAYNNAEYAKVSNNEVVTTKLNEAFKIMELLVPYLPEVYFYNERYYGAETASIMQFIINNYGKNEVSLIYSRDTYMYQIVGNVKRTFLYRPKRSGQSDVSFSVFKSNLFDAYRYNELKNKVDTTESNLYNLHSATFGLALALSGLRSRNIRSIGSFKKAQKTLCGLIENRVIVNGYNSPSVLAHSICDPDIVFRYSIIDLESRYLFYSSRPTVIPNFLTDLKDPTAVREINDQYFRRNPIDLQNL